MKEEELEVTLKKDEAPEWLRAGKIGLNILPDTKTSDFELDTINRIISEEIHLPKIFYGNTFGRYEVNEQTDKDLNSSQQEAVNFLSSANPFHIVHGPPGTGKTKTIVASVKAIASSGKRMIAVAPSNAAVDHLTLQLAKEGINVVRVGNLLKAGKDVLPFTLKIKAEADRQMDVVNRLKKESDSIRKKAFRYIRNFDKEAQQKRKAYRQELNILRKDIRKIVRQIEDHILGSTTIITGTFMGVQPFISGRKNPFDILFVDEAGQPSEPLIWGTAQHVNQLFLAGDPFQLPPTLFSDKAVELGLAKSLIEVGLEHKIPSTLLRMQYRMNDDLMQFSNAQFYEGKLSSSEHVAGQKLAEDPFLPFEFIDTAGCGFEEQQDDWGGISNPGELKILSKRLEELQGVSSSEIGLISPYRRQVALLQAEFKEKQIKCETIDSFQGQERMVIFISLVRSNDNQKIGFLSDYRRMNVALTRAQKKLILIGDSATIGQDEFYSELLHYIETKGSYRSAWEYFDA